MWSRKATALAGCGGFLALSGLVLLNYLFISVGIVMLSFLFLASFLNLWMPRVTIERTTSSRNIFEDGELEISFRLRNHGLLGGFVEIYDELPSQARLVRGSNYTLLYLKRQQEVSFTYTVQVPLRGHYHLGPVRLRVKDGVPSGAVSPAPVPAAMPATWVPWVPLSSESRPSYYWSS